ncbi:MAG: ribosome-associated translation inhibitor RaiA [Elusimicrobia bacterium]|nr:ribosome-associated translation inhibitor RaiA [Elusimicrobiota bacterium]MBD3411488.1 ribosome-associated translation inhibitor RaiA [Elusimicrobiota bacterium]
MKEAIVGNSPHVLVSYRNIEKQPGIENLIKEKVEKLTRVCDHIQSVRIAIEQLQKFQHTGRPYRVRIDITIPRTHEVVIRYDQSRGEMHGNLQTIIRRAFDSAWRSVRKLNKRQKGKEKHHRKKQNKYARE